MYECGQRRQGGIRIVVMLASLVGVVVFGCGDGTSSDCPDPPCDEVGCTEGEVNCGGECVDLNEDADHCGECDNACVTEVEGADPVCTPDGCEVACRAEEEVVCGETCADRETDRAHCGECGNACDAVEGASADCVEGSCEYVCEEEDYSICSDVCVDTMEDSEHCGGCDQSCRSSEQCSDGECVLQDFVVETVDVTDIGEESVDNVVDIALDDDGEPHLAFRGETTGDLGYAHREDGQWQVETVYSGEDIWEVVAIALDDAGNPHFAFNLVEDGQVWVVAPDSSNGWDAEPLVDTETREEAVGWGVDLVVDSEEKVHVMYRDVPEHMMHYAVGTPGDWDTEEVGFQNAIVYRGAIELDSDEIPHMIYGVALYEGLSYAQELVHARRLTEGWSKTSYTEISGLTRWSMALDEDDRLHVSCTDYQVAIGTLTYFHDDGSDLVVEAIGAPSIADDDVVAPEYRGWYSSIDIDDEQIPHISYFNRDDKVRYTRRVDDEWQTATVDEKEAGFWYTATSLAVDENGIPHIAFRSQGEHQLQYATLESD